MSAGERSTFDWKMAYRRLALFLHRRDKHNQFFERCEDARCNPDNAPHMSSAEADQLRSDDELGLGESRELLPYEEIETCSQCGSVLGLKGDTWEVVANQQAVNPVPSVPAEIESTEPKEPS